MKEKSLQTIIICIITLVVIGGGLYLLKDSNKTKQTIEEKQGEQPAKETTPIITKTERPALEKPQQAINRLENRKLVAVFKLTGKAENAKWGLAGGCNFTYICKAIISSKIKEKKKLKSGGIKIVEERKFEKVTSENIVSKPKISIDLNSLNFNKLVEYTTLASAGLAFLGADVGLAPVGIKFGAAAIKKYDKKIIDEKIIGPFASLMPEVHKQLLEAYKNKLLTIDAKIEKVQGKSYLVTYYQKKNGEPLLVEWTYSDGKKVNDEDEIRILKRANALIDNYLIPDENSVVGSSWKVNAMDFDEMMDPYMDGDYRGNLTVKRLDNSATGNWKLEIEPGNIYVDDNKTGKTIGEFQIKQGMIEAKPENVRVNNILISGIGKITKIQSHHLLFKSRLQGNCEFEAVVKTIDE